MRLIDADGITFSDKGLNKFIEAIPTAYDLESVIERLEQRSNDAISNHYAYEDDDHDGIFNDGLSEGYEKAIEIVKSGVSATNGQNGG